MNIHAWILLPILSVALPAAAQREKPVLPSSVVVERGPHHAVHQRVTPHVTSYGKTYLITNSFVELASGLNAWNPTIGRWEPSSETIGLLPGAAVARSGAHKVTWAANFNTEGALDVLTPDGKRFRSHILGLAYTDAVSGKSVLIAEPKDCIGEVIGNQVYYRDAFAGPFRADVRYTYSKSGISQDILIREAVPSPLDYDLSDARSRIEVWTEFVESPQPTKTRTLLKSEADVQTRQLMVDPDMTDETLDFGAMRIGHGSAFPLETGAGDPFEEQMVPVGKDWLRIDGRTFLIEKTDFRDIREKVDTLPKSAALKNPNKEQLQAAARLAPGRPQLIASLPGPVRKQARKDDGEMRMAAMIPPEKGFVLDYSMVASLTNFTFKSDTTYFVSGNVTLSGTTVLESAVIKYTNANSSTTRLIINGPLDCRTESHRPAIFTGKDDNTVGEIIAGSTGNPTTSYYGYFLDISGNTNVIDLHDVHMRRGYYGINMSSTSKLLLRHAQMSSNYAAVVIQSGQARLRNVLIHDGTFAFGGGGTNNWCENVTFHRLINLRSSSYNTFITNSLIISVTNNVFFAGANVVTNLAGTNIFQTVGSGARYLINNSTNRSSGTTNINPELLADLKKRTTYPPAVLATISQSTNLTAHVPRGGNIPDLGYSYDPIDYLLGGIVLSNVTVVVTNGAVVGIDAAATNYGFRLDSGAALISEGTPLNPNIFVRNHAVQELPTGVGTNRAPVFADTFPVPSGPTTARFRFTDFPQLVGTRLFNQERGRGTLTTLTLRDSQVRGGLVYLSGSQSNIVVGITNCLFERVSGEFYDYTASKVSLFNNLFRDGSYVLYIPPGGVWVWKDNLFDKVGWTQGGAENLTHNFNAYVTSYARLSPNGANDQVLSNSPAYLTGALGRHYLPASASQLVDQGSRTAGAASLFHYTTQTNQVRDGSTTVDIGLHYVALNAQGQPVDSDQDGRPDYVEDANGNGLQDGGESNIGDPIITLSPGATPWLWKYGVTKVDSQAGLTDPDTTTLIGGKLTVSISSGGQASDRLSIANIGTGAGQVSVSGNTVSFGGQAVGTVSGGDGATPLEVVFGAAAQLPAADAVLRAVAFTNDAPTPSLTPRAVAFGVEDGAGGASTMEFKNVNMTCPARLRVMMVMDVSGSLSPTDLSAEKAAAISFVNKLENTTSPGGDRVGLVTFCGCPVLNIGLSSAATINSAINGISSTCSGTAFHQPMNLASNHVANGATTDDAQVLVVMTDGQATQLGAGCPNPPGHNSDTRAQAIATANQIKSKGIRIITIGFGSGIDTDLLAQMASDGDSYPVGSSTDLQAVFDSIAARLCRGNALPIVGNDTDLSTAGTTWDWDWVPFQILASALLDNDLPGPPEESSQTLTVTGVSGLNPAVGTLSFDGTWIEYTPVLNQSGLVTFNYTVQDNGVPPQSANGTVTIEVVPYDDPPELTGDGFLGDRPEDAVIQVTFADLMTATLPYDYEQDPIVAFHYAGNCETFGIYEDVVVTDQNGNPNPGPIGPGGYWLVSLPQNYVGSLCLFNVYAEANFRLSRTSLEIWANITQVHDRPLVTITAPCDGIGSLDDGPCVVGKTGVQLAGEITDPEGAPPGNFIVSWSKVSGPGSVRFVGAANSTTATASFSAPGFYLLRLSASDGFLGGSDEILVSVETGNQTPVANAGPDQSVTVNNLVYLPGVVTDDGAVWPNEPDYLVSTWSVVSGPGTVTFDNPAAPATFASFSQLGTYVLRLEATDGSASGFDTATITIDPISPLQTIYNTDVVSAGLGGMRQEAPDCAGCGQNSFVLNSFDVPKAGSGTLQLAGVNGPISKAILYWAGPTDSIDPDINASVVVNGRMVVGRNIGTTHDNGWIYELQAGCASASLHSFTNSQAYRADVTELVRAYGNGDYVLTNFTKGHEVQINGASLVVFFDDGNPANNRDVVVYEGNDSNGAVEFYLDQGPVNSVVLNGTKVLLGGGFVSANVPGRNRVAQLLADGSLDAVFAPTTGVEGFDSSITVNAVAVGSGGIIYVAGEFTTVQGATRNRIARFTSAGALDTAFNPGTGPNATIRAIAVQADGKIVIAGDFTSVGGTVRNRIARLNTDGTLDAGFTIGSGANASVYALAIQSDGKIILGGDFTSVAGTTRPGFCRLNTSGSLDTGFGTTTGASSVRALALQSDMKVIIGGNFTAVNGTARNRIARLTTTGTLDTTFNPGTGANDQVNCVAIQGDGKVLIGGRFSSVGGSSRNRTARLTSIGALDGTYLPGAGPDDIDLGLPSQVNALAVDASGRVIIGGDFTRIDGVMVFHVARLNANGSLDYDFRTTDSGWNVGIPSVNYTAGEVSIELHVSDGQPMWLNCSSACIPYSDPTVKVNGVSWLVPQTTANQCSGTPDTQIFYGGSVPSANYPVGDTGSLWDIRESPVPSGALLTGLQTWRITAPNSNDLSPLPNKDDDLALIAALVKLPPGAGPALPPNPPVAFPANVPPIARPDTITVSRSVGRKLLNVLGNDTSLDGSLLRISTVSSPAHGTAEVRYDGSCVLYVPTPGYSGSDSFTYTLIDRNGNTASALVTLDVTGANAPVQLTANQNVNGTLGASGYFTTVRGGNRHADFYQIQLTALDQLTARLTSSAFGGHVFVRDPSGELIVSRAYDLRNGIAELSSFAVPVSGLYTIEVTSQDEGQTGAYTLEVTLNTGQAPVLQVWFGDVLVPNGGTIDLGILAGDGAIPVKLRNVGNAPVTGINVLQANFFQRESTLSPTVTPVLNPNQTATLVWQLQSLTPPGGISGTFAMSSSAGSYNATINALVNPEGSYPAVTISSPASGSSHLPHEPIPVTVTLASGFTGIYYHVRLYATSATGSRSLGDVQIDTFESSSASFLWKDPAPGVYSLVALVWELDWFDLSVVAGPGVSPAIHAIVATQAGNLPPVATADSYNLPVDAPTTTLEVLANDYDPNGDPLRITQAAVDNGSVTITSDGKRLRYTAPASSFGTDLIRYTITDGRGGNSKGLATVNIVNGATRITAPLDLAVKAVNQPVTIQATAASSAGAVSKVEFFVNGEKVGEDDSSPFSMSWTPTIVGYYNLTAIGTDSVGFFTESSVVRIKVTVNGLDNGDHAPVAFISNLQDNQLVREGLLEVQGTASDQDNAPTYQLELVNPESSTVVVGISSSTPVTEGVLGKLDLSRLRNGPYDLVLTVSEGFGSAHATVRIMVESQVKLGQFTFAETDLTVPVGGVPLTITRAYDSFNLNPGDFGYSWTMSINDLDVKIDEERTPTPIDPDVPAGDTLPMRVGGGRDVTLTLPDGRRTTFVFSLKPGPSQGGDPCFCYQAIWTPPSDVTAKLKPLNNDILQFIPFQTELDPYWAATGPGTPLDNFDFTGWTLELADGTALLITRPLLGQVELEPDGPLLQFADVYGPPKVTMITAKTGERIEIAGNRIRHFNSTSVKTRAVFIERDATHGNRITRIYTPESLDASDNPLPGAYAAVKYEYYNLGDARDGNLFQVHRLFDRSLPEVNAYNIVTYQYDDANYPRYITEIRDPNNTRVAYNKYDADGRLVELQDAEGNVTRFTHDLNSRKESVTDAFGRTTVHEFDPRGNITRTVNALGQTTTRTYDDRNNLLSQTDPLGSTTRFEYDGQGNRTKLTDNVGNVSTFTYNSRGQVLTSTDPRQNAENPGLSTTANTYDPTTGNLLTSRDALNQTTTYAYVNALLDTVTDPLGNRTKYDYYGTGETDGRPGDLKSTSIQQKNGVTFTTLSTTVYTYDANGNRATEQVTRTLPGGQPETLVRAFAYDGQDRLVQTTVDPGGLNQVSKTYYDAAGRVSSQVDALNRTTSFFYDARGNRVMTIYPSDANTPVSISRAVYDKQNRVIYQQDPHVAPLIPPAPHSYYSTNRGTHYIYDELGRVARTERLVDIVISVDCDGPIPCVSRFVIAGELMDDLDTPDVIEHLDPLISSRTSEFDAAGRLRLTRNTQGAETVFFYDAVGRRAKVRDALGHETSYTYDANGNQTAFTDALNRTTQTTYDKLNRATLVTYPVVNGQTLTRQTTYNAVGHKVQETDPAGVVTRFYYDAANRLTVVTNAFDLPDQAITRYQYDEAGNLASQTDANLRVTLFEYDKLGRRIKRTLPGTPVQFERDFYDAVGNRTIHTNFAGAITTFNYDAANRLLRKHPDPLRSEPDVVFTYEPDGRRLSMTDASSPNTTTPSTLYVYDRTGRLIRKRTWIDTAYVNLEYAYDSESRVTSIQSWGNTRLSYTYNALGQLGTMTDLELSSTAQATTYAYDVVGNLQSYTYPKANGQTDGVKTSYAYDNLNRLTVMNVTKGSGGGMTTLAAMDYNPVDRPIDPSGNRRAAREAVTAFGSTQTHNVNYDYDPLYRLTKEDVIAGTPNGSVVYDAQAGYSDPAGFGYDPVGNRKSRTVAASLQSAGVTQFSGQQYDERDRLTGAGNVFDANGNTLRGTVTPVQTADDLYDFENHLIQRTTSGKSVQLVYNGDGVRVKKVVTDGTTTTTYYLVDDVNPTGYAQVLEEWGWDAVQGATVQLRRYAYGLDLVCQSTRPNFSSSWTTSFYGYDGHGSVRFLMNQEGTISDTYTYDAFGILIAQQNSGTATPNNYRYAGEQFDSDLSLYYNRARYLNPNTGRFWTMDSYEGKSQDPLSLHKYLYAHANPVNGRDPSGHSFILEFSIAAAKKGAIAGITLGAINGAFTYAKTKSLKAAVWQGSKTAGLTGFAFISPAFAVSMLATLPAQVGLGIYNEDITAKDTPEMLTYVAAAVALNYLFKTQAVPPDPAVVIGILRDASRTGIGNTGVGSATVSEALMAGRAWVGDTFKVASNGAWISANGLRQFRPPSYKPRQGKWQANLEERAAPNGKWTANSHIDIKTTAGPNMALENAAAASAAITQESEEEEY